MKLDAAADDIRVTSKSKLRTSMFVLEQGQGEQRLKFYANESWPNGTALSITCRSTARVRLIQNQNATPRRHKGESDKKLWA